LRYENFTNRNIFLFFYQFSVLEAEEFLYKQLQKNQSAKTAKVYTMS